MNTCGTPDQGRIRAGSRGRARRLTFTVPGDEYAVVSSLLLLAVFGYPASVNQRCWQSNQMPKIWFTEIKTMLCVWQPSIHWHPYGYRYKIHLINETLWTFIFWNFWVKYIESKRHGRIFTLANRNLFFLEWMAAATCQVKGLGAVKLKNPTRALAPNCSKLWKHRCCIKTIFYSHNDESKLWGLRFHWYVQMIRCRILRKPMCDAQDLLFTLWSPVLNAQMIKLASNLAANWFLLFQPWVNNGLVVLFEHAWNDYYDILWLCPSLKCPGTFLMWCFCWFCASSFSCSSRSSWPTLRSCWRLGCCTTFACKTKTSSSVGKFAEMNNKHISDLDEKTNIWKNLMPNSVVFLVDSLCREPLSECMTMVEGAL